MFPTQSITGLRAGDLSSLENIKITIDYLENETTKAVDRSHSYTRSEEAGMDDENDLHKFIRGTGLEAQLTKSVIESNQQRQMEEEARER